MAGWQKFQIKDIGKVVTGRTPSVDFPEHWGRYLPFITPTDMDGRRTIDNSLRYLSEEGAKAFNRNIIPKGIGVSCIGWQMGKSILINQPCVTNQQINSIIPYEDLVDVNYLYYVFTSRRDELFRLGVGGSRTPILKKSDFERLEVTLPPLPEQREIARILAAFDDKIDLNRRMNAALEATARALFQSWFVDFDPVRAKAEGRAPEGMDAATAALFPDSFEDSALGQIPSGWKISQLSQYVDIVRGVSYRSDELQDSNVALVTLKSIERGGGYRPDGLKPFVGKYKLSQVLDGGDVIVAHTDVTQAAELLGRAARVRIDPKYDTFVASLDLAIVRPKEPLNRIFLYLLLAHPAFSSYAQGYANGTTVLHLNNRAIPNYIVIVPPSSLISKFGDLIDCFFSRADVLNREIGTLAETRDALLPRLISGELRVGEI